MTQKLSEKGYTVPPSNSEIAEQNKEKEKAAKFNLIDQGELLLNLQRRSGLEVPNIHTQERHLIPCPTLSGETFVKKIPPQSITPTDPNSRKSYKKEFKKESRKKKITKSFEHDDAPGILDSLNPLLSPHSPSSGSGLLSPHHHDKSKVSPKQREKKAGHNKLNFFFAAKTLPKPPKKKFDATEPLKSPVSSAKPSSPLENLNSKSDVDPGNSDSRSRANSFSADSNSKVKWPSSSESP